MWIKMKAHTMQGEDPEEFYSNSGIPWRISKAEFNAVLEQRQ